MSYKSSITCCYAFCRCWVLCSVFYSCSPCFISPIKLQVEFSNSFKDHSFANACISVRQSDKKLILIDFMRKTLCIKYTDDSSKTEFERSAFPFPKNLENALLVNSFRVGYEKYSSLNSIYVNKSRDNRNQKSHFSLKKLLRQRVLRIEVQHTSSTENPVFAANSQVLEQRC